MKEVRILFNRCVFVCINISLILMCMRFVDTQYCQRFQNIKAEHIHIQLNICACVYVHKAGTVVLLILLLFIFLKFECFTV